MTVRELLEDQSEKGINFRKSINRNLTTEQGQELTCLKCGEKYKRGYFDFYNLCNTCFEPYKDQQHYGIYDVNEWVKITNE